MRGTKARLLVAVVALCAAIAGGSSGASGSFPGKNGALVFDAVDGHTQSVQIFRVSAGGTGLAQLTTTTGAVWNEDPAFSANGRRIYFGSFDRSTTLPTHIYRMDTNGMGRQLADRSSNFTHVWPSVNHSDSSLAVVEYGPNGRAVISTMDTSGGKLTLVANAAHLQGNGSPEYAPHGPRIVFYRLTYNSDGQGIAKSNLFVRNGTRNSNITARDSGQFFNPSWAPNGQGLLAIRGDRTLVSMRPNGANVHVLTTVSGTETHIDGAVYSPDGTMIAYLQCTGDCGDPGLAGHGSIWVMNADGSNKHRVFNGTSAVQPANRLSWGVS